MSLRIIVGIDVIKQTLLALAFNGFLSVCFFALGFQIFVRNSSVNDILLDFVCTKIYEFMNQLAKLPDCLTSWHHCTQSWPSTSCFNFVSSLVFFVRWNQRPLNIQYPLISIFTWITFHYPLFIRVPFAVSWELNNGETVFHLPIIIKRILIWMRKNQHFWSRSLQETTKQ